jgi:ribosomal protein S18 acetylase RimI-like enzyme
VKTITLESASDYLDWRWTPGCAVEIVNLTVGSERRRGHGRRLVALLLERVRYDADLVFAQTRASNGIAQDFYAGVGFRRLGTLERFYGAEDAVVWGRDLA